MKSKAAIQVEPGGPVVIEEIDIPDPGPNQVTVRNFASGVCYSQVHQLRNAELPRPMGLGHEGSGVIIQIGKEVTHVGEGDHVISTWVPRSPISGFAWLHNFRRLRTRYERLAELHLAFMKLGCAVICQRMLSWPAR